MGGEPESMVSKGKRKAKVSERRVNPVECLKILNKFMIKKNKRSLDLMTMEVTYVYGDKMF